MDADTKYLILPHREYISNLAKLRFRIKNEYNPDFIIGILRGGSIIGTQLSYELTNKAAAISAGRYGNENERLVMGNIACWFPILPGQKGLIVDDVSDKGFTLGGKPGEYQGVLEHIQKLYPENEFKTATLYIKTGTVFVPDFYIAEVDPKTWIKFPYEWDIKDAVQEEEMRISSLETEKILAKQIQLPNPDNFLDF